MQLCTFLSYNKHEAIIRLYDEGDVGAIVYYLGLIVTKLDKRVIALANKLDFILITMPENRAELRYSDAISEIMELIVKNRLSETYFASEIIESISHLSKNQRNINSVLNIIRDRIHCSIFLLDFRLRILNRAEWPVDRGLPVNNIINEYVKIENVEESIVYIVIDEKEFWISKSLISNQDGLDIFMLIIKEVDDLTDDICKQATDVIKTYLNLWTDNYSKIEIEQLVSSILNDEPEKMRRIAEILHIDVSKISAMYIFTINDISDEIHYKNELIRTEDIIKNFIQGYNNIFVTSIYEKDIVIFFDRQQECIDEYLEELVLELNKNRININISIFETLITTIDARNSYLLNSLYRYDASLIFKRKKIFSSSEINFAKHCKDICMMGESEVNNKKNILRILLDEKNGDTLKETLSIFMLDGDRNIEKTADLVYVHKNTIKYRIKRLKDIFGFNINKMPEAYELYLASALERLLNN